MIIKTKMKSSVANELNADNQNDDVVGFSLLDFVKEVVKNRT